MLILDVTVLKDINVEMDHVSEIAMLKEFHAEFLDLIKKHVLTSYIFKHLLQLFVESLIKELK